MAEGNSAEIMFIGSEGATGCMQLLGPAATPTSCFIQLPATGFRIRHDEFANFFHHSNEIRSRVLAFIQHEAFTQSQIAGCNRLHLASGRLARWLLMAMDRTHSPQLDFTQEFLAEMLALQRTTVSSIAASLHEAGLIHYARGRVTILDRPGLERTACSCYPTARRLLEELYRNEQTLRDNASLAG